MSKKLTQSEVLQRFRNAHGDSYDYANVRYTKSSEKVQIRCRIHDLIFEQSIHHHANGSGCPHCGIRHNARQPYYEYDGVRYPSLKALCIKYELNEAVMQKRLQNGWSLYDSVERPHVPAAKSWEYMGNHYQSFGALYDHVNPTCSYNTFRRRLNEGMSIEDAATKIPSHGHANGLVYVITNLVNGMKYVGITTETAEIRFARHIAGANAKKYTNKMSLSVAIRKHGKQSFSVKTLEHAVNTTELRKLEKIYIEKLRCLAPNGYNLSAGGSIGKPKGKFTVIEGLKFSSLKQAARYLSKNRGISYSAAEKRISEDRINVKTLGKKITVEAYGNIFESKAALARYMFNEGIAPSVGAATHRIYRGEIDYEEIE